MKKIGILILILGSIALFAQRPGDEIELQNPPFFDNEIKADQIKIPAWKAVGPKGGYIKAIAFNPKNNKEIYAIMYSYPGLVYYTQNSGKKWKRIAEINDWLYDIAVDPKNPETLYMVSNWRIYKSEDGGKNWEPHYFQSSSSADYDPANGSARGYQGIVINPQNPKIIYVGGYVYYSSSGKSDLAVLKSKDGGETWTAKKLASNGRYANTYCLAMNPNNPSELYTGGQYYDGFKYVYRVFKSTNAGDSWSNITGIIGSTPYSIVIDPKNPSKVYVGAWGGVYRSTNGGQTWAKNQGYVYLYKLAIDPSSTNTLYAGYADCCYKSIDGGVNWTRYEQGLHGICTDFLIPSSSSSLEGLVYVQSGQVYYASSCGFFKSANSGVSWKASVGGMNASVIAALAVAASNPKTIYVEVESDGLFKSINSGKSWKRLPYFYRCESIVSLVVNPKNANEMYLLAGG